MNKVKQQVISYFRDNYIKQVNEVINRIKDVLLSSALDQSEDHLIDVLFNDDELTIDYKDINIITTGANARALKETLEFFVETIGNEYNMLLDGTHPELPEDYKEKLKTTKKDKE